MCSVDAFICGCQNRVGEVINALCDTKLTYYINKQEQIPHETPDETLNKTVNKIPDNTSDNTDSNNDEHHAGSPF